jgi:hypothetical protein
MSCLPYSSALNIAAIWSSKMSVDFHQATRHYNPEVGILHSHLCDNLRSNIEVGWIADFHWSLSLHVARGSDNANVLSYNLHIILLNVPYVNVRSHCLYSFETKNFNTR